jgi:hypothetical protein
MSVTRFEKTCGHMGVGRSGQGGQAASSRHLRNAGLGEYGRRRFLTSAVGIPDRATDCVFADGANSGRCVGHDGAGHTRPQSGRKLLVPLPPSTNSSMPWRNWSHLTPEKAQLWRLHWTPPTDHRDGSARGCAAHLPKESERRNSKSDCIFKQSSW